MKRIVAIILTVVMAIGLCSCGETADTSSKAESSATSSAATTAPQKEEQEAAATEAPEAASSTATVSTAEITEYKTFKIGHNVYIPGAYVFSTMEKNREMVTNAFGDEAMAVYDDISVEKIVQDIENLISSGCDGIIAWIPAETVMVTVAEMCKEAQVPFVFTNKFPESEEVKEQLLSNPYFVGDVGPDNYSYGVVTAEKALEEGYKTCIITGAAIGNATSEPRIKGFRDVFEANGGTVIDELRNEGASASTTSIQDCLTAHMDDDIDFIYGAGSDFAVAAVNVCNSFGLDIPVLANDFEPDVLSNLNEETGPIYMAFGDNYIDGTFAAIMLQNYLEGNPIVDEDGRPAWFMNVPSFTINGEGQLELFNKLFVNGSCYTDDELLAMSTLRNPDFDYDAMEQVILNFSLEERILANYEAGLVTDEELAAAGLSAN